MRERRVRELRPGARACGATLDSISTGCGYRIGYGGPHRTDPSVTDMEIAMGYFDQLRGKSPVDPSSRSRNRQGPVADVTLIDHHNPLAAPGRRVSHLEGRGATL